MLVKEKSPATEAFFEPFRVLLYYEEKFRFYVAQCLETGNVVTADDAATARNMVTELLEDEIAYAIIHGNLKNLTSSPAPLEIRTRWQKAAQAKPVKRIYLNIDARELKLDEPDMVSTEVKVADATA